MTRGWVHTVYRQGIWIKEIDGEGQMLSHEKDEGGRRASERRIVRTTRRRATGVVPASWRFGAGE